MILVILGTSSWNFERLVKEVDKLAKNLNEDVIIQIGDTDYKPLHAEYFRFMSKEKIEYFYKNARIIISHAGAGSLISAVKYEKNIILVPRRKKYEEHFDDHQAEIAKKFEKLGFNIIWDVKKIQNTLNEINNDSIHFKSEKENLVNALKNYLNEAILN